MKRRRILLLILAPFLCVMLYVVVEASIKSNVPRARSNGEHLSFTSLAQTEVVVVSRLFAHTNFVAREYRFSRDGEHSQVTVFDAYVTQRGNETEWTSSEGLVTRDLTKKELEGLDETVSYFREVREERSSATRHFRLTYYRDGKKIGEEFYIGFSLPDRLTYLALASSRSVAGQSPEIAQLAQQFGVSEERVSRMMPFEMLEIEKPDQPSAPVATSGRDSL